MPVLSLDPTKDHILPLALQVAPDFTHKNNRLLGSCRLSMLDPKINTRRKKPPPFSYLPLSTRVNSYGVLLGLGVVRYVARAVRYRARGFLRFRKTVVGVSSVVWTGGHNGLGLPLVGSWTYLL